MRFDSRDRSCPRGLFLDLATGKPIRWLIWVEMANSPEQESVFEAFREEPNAAVARGVLLDAIRYRGKARLRFLPAAPVFGVKPTPARDLMGSLAEARSRVDQRLLVLGKECAEPRCHKLARWQVSFEQLIEPERDAEGKLHERAVCVRRLAFCENHYRAPRVISIRGVESEVEITEGRPQ